MYLLCGDGYFSYSFTQTLMNVQWIPPCVIIMLLVETLMVAISVYAKEDTQAMEHLVLVSRSPFEFNSLISESTHCDSKLRMHIHLTHSMHAYIYICMTSCLSKRVRIISLIFDTHIHVHCHRVGRLYM